MQGNSRRTLATIMFTDMVGYTALMQRDEIQAREKRARHRSVFEEMHRKYNGRIIQYFGDGTLSIFSSSVHAVACAIEMQELLKAPIEVPLRIGIHMGDIIIEEDNLIGDAVNLASRIESFSVPGAVLISDVLYEQVKNQTQFSFYSLGKFQLKNVERPFGIYALSNEGLVTPDPANLKGKGQRQSAPNNNLPKVLTSFLGREKEIREVIELLQGNRLITLTGPGGTGKTRLSIQIACEVDALFPDGIYWVPLAAITDFDIVPSAIAQQLGLKEDIVLSIEEVILNFFQEKEALLILDNFEQIVQAAPLVEVLIKSTEHLCILVTSRIVLQIFGEIEFPVPPLGVPKRNNQHNIEELAIVPSVALFSQRAKANRSKFHLNQENVSDVAEICRQLDGLPLAIELAAARTKIFSPNSLLKKLNKRLDLLKGGGQFPERHQTLRQTIAWSYDLLEPSEKLLFSKISVFVGGSTIEAIEEVCGQNGLADWDITDGVIALMDKSLIQSEETESEKRFYLLETIREFAVETLKESKNITELKERHIQYYLRLAEEAAPHLSKKEGDLWNDRLFKDQPNFRAAIDYAIELNKIALAYRLGLALRPFWGTRGLTKEGVNQLEKLSQIPVDKSLYEERLNVLQVLGMLYLYIPILDKAIVMLKECLDYWRRKADKRRMGLSLNDLGWASILIGQARQGIDFSLEAKGIFEQLPDESRLVASLNNLGWAYMMTGRPVEATKYFEQTLKKTKQLGDQRRNAFAIMNMGYTNYLKGEYTIAEAQILESMIIPKKISDKLLLGNAHRSLGFIKYAKGEFEAMPEISEETERYGHESNGNYFVAGAYEIRALYAFAKKDFLQAEKWINKAAKIWEVAPVLHWLKRTMHVQANIALALEEVEDAVAYSKKLLENELEEECYFGFLLGVEVTARIAALQKNHLASAQLFINVQALREKVQMPIVESEKHIYRELTENLQRHLSLQTLNKIESERISEHKLLKLAKDILEG